MKKSWIGVQGSEGPRNSHPTFTRPHSGRRWSVPLQERSKTLTRPCIRSGGEDAPPSALASGLGQGRLIRAHPAGAGWGDGERGEAPHFSAHALPFKDSSERGCAWGGAKTPPPPTPQLK